METDLKKCCTKWYLTGIVLLGFCARIARSIIDKDIKQDAVLYMNMARLWPDQGIEAAYTSMSWIPPLWPWFLSVFYSWGFSPEIVAEVTGVILGTTVIVSVYYICRHIFKKESYALAGALLITIHPYLIRLSTEMLRDTVYIPLVAFALALAVSASINHRWWKWSLYAVVCALAVMTRREGGELVVFLSCWSVVDLIQKRNEFKQAFKRLALTNILVYFIFLAIVLPVQNELSKTRCTWRVIPNDVYSQLRNVFRVSEENLFKTIGEK